MTCPFTPTRAPPLLPTSSPISLSFPTTDTPATDTDTAGRLAVLTLNDPAKLNAVRLSDVHALIEALSWLAEQPRVAVVILTAQGRFFSSGADVSDPTRDPGPGLSTLADHERAAASDPEALRQLGHFYGSRIALGNGRLARELAHFPKVLVGAMNGPAVGIMAAALGHCDLLYAHEDFWLAVPFTSLGLVVEGGASTTFVRKLGLGRAQEVLLEGRRIGAEALAQTGFLTRVIPRSGKEGEHILDAVLQHVREHLLPPTADPFALTYSKQLIQRATYEPIGREEANQAELRGAERVFTSGIPLAKFAAIAGGKRHKL